MKVRDLIALLVSLIMITSSQYYNFAMPENGDANNTIVDDDSVISDSAIVTDGVDLFSSEATIEFAAGDGSEKNPYQIATAEQFNLIEKYGDSYFVLTNNITDSVKCTNFSGHLDGRNYSIYNQNGSVFETVSGTVCNLNVINGSIYVNTTYDRAYKILVQGTYDNIGGIADTLNAPGEIRNCNYKGNIKVVTTDNYASCFYQRIGGIVGFNNGGLIEECTTEGRINIKSVNIVTVGGIVGENWGKINKCFARMNIQSQSNYNYFDKYSRSYAESWVGGVVGNTTDGYLPTNCLSAPNILSSSCNDGTNWLCKTGIFFCKRENTFGNIEDKLINIYSYKDTALYKDGVLIEDSDLDDSIEKSRDELNDIWYRIKNDLPINFPQDDNNVVINFEKSEYEFELGGDYLYQLTVNLNSLINNKNEITFTSSNTDVAEISEFYVETDVLTKNVSILCDLNLKDLGKTVITVKNSEGTSASCQITVKAKDNRTVRIESDKYELIVGEALTIFPKITDNGKENEDKSDVKWSTSNSRICSITEGDNGVAILKAANSGTVTITATLSNGANTKIILTVKDGFAVDKDGWSFVNGREGFDYSNEYKISEKRYNEVFGNAYLAAARANDNVYTSMIPNSWGGNCFGMSTAAILLYLNKLDWSEYDKLYENNFSTVNSFYDTIQYNRLNPDTLKKAAFSSAGKNSEITKMIERYQIIQSSAKEYKAGKIGNYSSLKDLNKGFWDISVTNNTINYTHKENGKYISDLLQKVINSDKPLCLDLIYNSGDLVDPVVGHTIVTRTDKTPEDEGNGWWKVYVYDPNTPYIDDSNTKKYTDTLRSYYYNYLLQNNNDRYVELNPSQNKWRYYGAVNSGVRDKYLGTDEKNNLINIHKEETLEGVTYEMNYPEYIYLYDISVLPTEMNGTEPFVSEDVIYIYLSDNTKMNLYSESGRLLAIADKGNIVATDTTVEPLLHGGSTIEDNAAVHMLVIPKDKYMIKYLEGNDISIVGFSNIINFKASKETDVNIDLNNNLLTAISLANDNYISIQSNNIFDNDSYSSVILDGFISDNDNIQLSLNDDNIVETNYLTTSNNTIKVYVDNGDDFGENLLGEVSKTNPRISVNTMGKVIDDTKSIKGDVNGDGTVTTKDAVLALQMSTGKRAVDLIADVNGDGSVTTKDAVLILRYSTGKINKF